jgi:hypothetical protein
MCEDQLYQVERELLCLRSIWMRSRRGCEPCMHWCGDGLVVWDGNTFGSSRVRGSAARIIARVWHKAEGRRHMCETSEESILLSWWNAQQHGVQFTCHHLSSFSRASIPPPPEAASAALVRLSPRTGICSQHVATLYSVKTFEQYDLKSHASVYVLYGPHTSAWRDSLKFCYTKTFLIILRRPLGSCRTFGRPSTPGPSGSRSSRPKEPRLSTSILLPWKVKGNFDGALEHTHRRHLPLSQL